MLIWCHSDYPKLPSWNCKFRGVFCSFTGCTQLHLHLEGNISSNWLRGEIRHLWPLLQEIRVCMWAGKWRQKSCPFYYGPGCLEFSSWLPHAMGWHVFALQARETMLQLKCFPPVSLHVHDTWGWTRRCFLDLGEGPVGACSLTSMRIPNSWKIVNLLENGAWMGGIILIVLRARQAGLQLWHSSMEAH